MKDIDLESLLLAVVALVVVVCATGLLNRGCSVEAYKACVGKATETTQCKGLEP